MSCKGYREQGIEVIVRPKTENRVGREDIRMTTGELRERPGYVVSEK